MNPSHATIAAQSAILNLVSEYLGKVNITAQACYDRWPEARGMRRRLFDLAAECGISPAKVAKDLEAAQIDRNGGRW